MWIGILILSPFVGFLLNGAYFKNKNVKLAGAIASAAMLISFYSACILFTKLTNLPIAEREISHSFFSWLEVGQLRLNVEFLVDQISGIMILIITGVGLLIHIFSVGYMSHEKAPSRYFAYLNLFVFSMLILVLGENLALLFVGWEGVGLCSYLLIGFWFTDKEKASAGMKAFITNRIGDAGLLVGLFLLFYIGGTLSISELLAQGPYTKEIGFGLISFACLALFVGATGKSAQIPLYVWLPDAMAGPTPVSALIHAATMVTAGIYMIVRLNPIFMAAPLVMEIIAWIGALTALFAAMIGVLQWDIKKILAYSTVSQLGYMFLAVGVGAFSAGMFHLMTHAFFKALMFLGAGSVIHSLQEEQDIRKMGGLKNIMPVTHITFLVGWLAITGIPPFAGFFSKDEILWMSFHSPMGGQALWLIGFITAGLTAFYMTRLMYFTFWQSPQYSNEVHPHESPASMTIPLVLLAALAAFSGFLGVPHIIGDLMGHLPNVIHNWLAPKIVEIPGLEKANVKVEAILMILSVILAASASYFAIYLYGKNRELANSLKNKFPKTNQMVSNKFYVDELIQSRILKPCIELGKGLWAYIDVSFIDKITFHLTNFVQESASGVRLLHQGKMQQYALYMVLGMLVGLSYVLLG